MELTVNVHQRLLELLPKLDLLTAESSYREASQLLSYALKSDHISAFTCGELTFFMGLCLKRMSLRAPSQKIAIEEYNSGQMSIIVGIILLTKGLL